MKRTITTLLLALCACVALVLAAVNAGGVGK